jgi:hypothetical protein
LIIPISVLLNKLIAGDYFQRPILPNADPNRQDHSAAGRSNALLALERRPFLSCDTCGSPLS